jgi:hypothetical protein
MIPLFFPFLFFILTQTVFSSLCTSVSMSVIPSPAHCDPVLFPESSMLSVHMEGFEWDYDAATPAAILALLDVKLFFPTMTPDLDDLFRQYWSRSVPLLFDIRCPEAVYYFNSRAQRLVIPLMVSTCDLVPHDDGMPRVYVMTLGWDSAALYYKAGSEPLALDEVMLRVETSALPARLCPDDRVTFETSASLPRLVLPLFQQSGDGETRETVENDQDGNAASSARKGEEHTVEGLRFNLRRSRATSTAVLEFARFHVAGVACPRPVKLTREGAEWWYLRDPVSLIIGGAHQEHGSEGGDHGDDAGAASGEHERLAVTILPFQALMGNAGASLLISPLSLEVNVPGIGTHAVSLDEVFALRKLGTVSVKLLRLRHRWLRSPTDIAVTFSSEQGQLAVEIGTVSVRCDDEVRDAMGKLKLAPTSKAKAKASKKKSGGIVPRYYIIYFLFLRRGELTFFFFFLYAVRFSTMRSDQRQG